VTYEGRQPLKDWKIINEELKAYRAGLEEKPQIVVVNKMDTRPPEDALRPLEQECRRRRIPFFRISAVSGEGIPSLMEAVWKELQVLREEMASGGPPAEGSRSSGSSAS